MKLFGVLTSCIALLLWMGPVWAAPVAWEIDIHKSKLGFTGVQSGQPFDGVFGKFTISVNFDPAHPETGSIEAVIDSASARTGDSERDQALPTKEWFAVVQFPTATFKSKAIMATKTASMDAACYDAIGELVIRGISKSITLPFCLSAEGDATRVRGKIALMRNDFGVGQGDWNNESMVKFSVDVVIDLFARKKG